MDFHKRFDPTDLYSAKGLVIVITGGGSGIGLAIAAALHQSGAKRIYLLGRRHEVLESAVKTLLGSPAAPAPEKDATIVPLTCDVTSPKSISDVVEIIEKHDGVVDVLVNNAGMIGPRLNDIHNQDTIKGLRDLMLQDWDAWGPTMATNASSVIGVSAAFLPLMDAANRKRGWEGGKVTGANRARKLSKAEGVDENDKRLAQIITVASISAFMRKISAGLAYNGSKAAAVHLAKILETLLAEWGIRSNVVAPGPYPSDMTAGGKKVFGVDENPAGRQGSEQDIAGLVLFLVGKGGAYINGSVQLTDGGRLGVHPSVY